MSQKVSKEDQAAHEPYVHTNDLVVKNNIIKYRVEQGLAPNSVEQSEIDLMHEAAELFPGVRNLNEAINMLQWHKRRAGNEK